MKTLSIFFLTTFISIGCIFSQNVEHQELINEIDNITNQIQENPDNDALYVKRAEQIFLLRSVYPKGDEVPYTLKSVMDDMDKAIQLNPTAEYYAMRGEYHRDIHMNLGAAIDDLTKAIELDPENPRWYLQRSNYKSVNGACDDIAKAAEYGSTAGQEIHEDLCDNQPRESEMSEGVSLR